MAILVNLQNISLAGSDRSLLDDLSLTIASGDRIGVVGINGTGKSTLLKIIAGDVAPDSGRIVRGRDVRVARLEQIPVLARGTVREVVGTGWEADATLDRLGMLDASDTDTSQLSGGQRKRVALAQLFVKPFDVLILDEPTNHLDLDAISWLETQIQDFRGAIVLVSHDRFLLDQVTTRMVEIDRGKTFLHAGGYAQLLETQAEREELAASVEQTRQNLARTELAWLRRGVKARSTKPQARIDAAHRLLAARPQSAARPGSLDLGLDTPRLGNTVIKAHHVGFSFSGAHEVLRGIDLELGPGDRVGIVGPNGVGKSTLVNLLARRLEPTAGTIKYGPTVVTSYFEQNDGDMDLDATIQELVAGPQGTPGSPADVALMKRFWFSGALTKTRAKDLSGGERRRLQLMLALVSRPNVLFLDEPTNDLDLETIRLIEDFLSQWPGTLVVVSHDRAFLSRTTDRLLQIHRDGTMADVAGGIDAWIAASKGTDSREEGEKVAGAPVVDVTMGRRVRDAEKEMVRLERRRSALSEKLLASSDHVEQNRLGSELAVVQHSLALAEEKWLALLDQ
ncbi:MAG TPA: ABC-F family ATP-binding cassette domain-containing protein [Acidimicrobiales bacterium]|nr:ABC-F family ATP-binding cassette domain-containing protein [Acidimicrobiales bacterium]